MQKNILLSCTGVVALIAGTPSLAQTAEPAVQAGKAPTTQTSDPASADGLQDIIVTAQRRSESLQRAAVAVDVVTSGELTRAGVVTATTLNAAVPSLSVQQGGGSNTVFFIRGVGNFSFNGYTDPAVAFNLDGVYLGRPTSTTGAFFDLDRIEVLKGPQGTLYGRNATGGAINVIPARPKLNQLSAAISAGYGNYNAIDGEAMVNLPIGTKAALRVSGKYVNRDGYNRDGTLDDKGEAVRAQLLFEPTSNLNVRLAADYSHQGGSGPGGSYLGHIAYSAGAPASATAPANYIFTSANLDPYSGLNSPEARAYFAQRTIPSTLINPAPLATPSLDNDYWGALAEVNLTTSVGTLTVIPAYRKSRLKDVFNGPSFRDGIQDETDKQFSLEARFAGTRVGPFDWLVGGYYFNEKVTAKYAFNQYQITTFNDLSSQTKSYAAFGRITGHVSDSFRLVAGGRYTKDNKKFFGDAQTLVDICVVPTGCFGGPSLPVVLTLNQIPNGPTIPGVPVPYGANGNLILYFPLTVARSANRGRFTYRAAVEFDVGPRSLLYASYETGYRSGGFSIALGREQFDPEYLTAFTIGSKNRFLDNRLQLNVEAFHWKYSNQQVSHLGFDSTGTTSFFTENIGRSTLQGVDVEAQFLATPTTLLNATAQYLDAKTDRFVYDVPAGAGTIPPAVGCPISNTNDGSGLPVYRVDCSNKQAFNSPKWSINAGVEQTIPLGAHKLVLTGSTRYRSNAVIGFEYLPQMNSGAHTLFDVSLMFGDAGDRWSISAYVRNLGDEKVKSFVQYGAAPGNTISAIYAAPRTYGVRAAYKF